MSVDNRTGINWNNKKKKSKGCSAGPIQHCSLKADCTLAPEIVPSFISRGAPHQAVRKDSTSKERKLNTRIFPAPRNLLQVLGSFTCPEVGTWGRLFNFPSEGRHAEDFYVWKIQRLRPGLNPRTREPEASMLTTRPPKPSIQWILHSTTHTQQGCENMRHTQPRQGTRKWLSVTVLYTSTDICKIK
jgi:hypothetical protein